MPYDKKVRFRFKQLGHGKAVRFAFKEKSKLLEVAYFKKVAGKLVKQNILHRR